MYNKSITSSLMKCRTCDILFCCGDPSLSVFSTAGVLHSYGGAGGVCGRHGDGHACLGHHDRSGNSFRHLGGAVNDPLFNQTAKD